MQRLRMFLLALVAVGMSGCVAAEGRSSYPVYADNGWGGWNGGYYGNRSVYRGGSYPYYRDDRYWNDRYRRNDDDRLRDSNRRFVRPESDTTCDQRTRVCYRDKRANSSETRQYYGDRAARRVDRLTGDAETRRIFVPKRGAVCNNTSRVCSTGDDANRRLTREVYGKRAARKIDRRND